MSLAPYFEFCTNGHKFQYPQNIQPFPLNYKIKINHARVCWNSPSNYNIFAICFGPYKSLA